MAIDRVDPSIRPDFVREVLPEHFAQSYPTLITFLEAYYEFMNQEDEFGEAVKDLYAIRDIGFTELKYLDNMLEEVGLGISQDFFENPREIVRNFAKFFRVKGSITSIKGFFRAFYGIDDVEVEYPKDRIFTIGDPESIVGSESTKVIQDGAALQVLSILVKSSLTLSKWSELYKKYVHPAGVHLFHEMKVHQDTKITVRARQSIPEIDSDLEYELDIAKAKIKFVTPQIAKSNIGNGNDYIVYGEGISWKDFNINSGLAVGDSAGNEETLVMWASYDDYIKQNYVTESERDGAYVQPENIQIAPVDLSLTAETEDAKYVQIGPVDYSFLKPGGPGASTTIHPAGAFFIPGEEVSEPIGGIDTPSLNAGRSAAECPPAFFGFAYSGVVAPAIDDLNNTTFGPQIAVAPDQSIYYSVPDATYNGPLVSGPAVRSINVDLESVFGAETYAEAKRKGWRTYLARVYYRGNGGYITININNIISHTINPETETLFGQQDVTPFDVTFPIVPLDDIDTLFISMTGDDMNWSSVELNGGTSYQLFLYDVFFVFSLVPETIWDWVKYDDVRYNPYMFDLGHNMTVRSSRISELSNKTALEIKDLLI